MRTRTSCLRLALLVSSAALAGALAGQSSAAASGGVVAPPAKAERFALHGIARSEGKWLASIEDRETEGRVAWLEKDQMFSGYYLKEISEKSAVIVEQQTGRATTLFLQFSAAKKRAGDALPVLVRLDAADAGGLTKAATILATAQLKPATGPLPPQMAPSPKEISEAEASLKEAPKAQAGSPNQ